MNETTLVVKEKQPTPYVTFGSIPPNDFFIYKNNLYLRLEVSDVLQSKVGFPAYLLGGVRYRPVVHFQPDTAVRAVRHVEITYYPTEEQENVR
jgi:hypothetical protein